jgi:hypothetical protein
LERLGSGSLGARHVLEIAAGRSVRGVRRPDHSLAAMARPSLIRAAFSLSYGFRVITSGLRFSATSGSRLGF